MAAKDQDELVGSGTPVIALASPHDDWVVRVALGDRNVARMHIGDSAVVRFGEYGATPFSGMVTALADKASQTTGSFDVEVEVAPNKAALLSGMVAKVDIETE